MSESEGRLEAGRKGTNWKRAVLWCLRDQIAGGAAEEEESTSTHDIMLMNCPFRRMLSACALILVRTSSSLTAITSSISRLSSRISATLCRRRRVRPWARARAA